MVSLSVIADIHLANHPRFGGVVRGGINDRAARILTALQAAVDATPPGSLWVLGDLFDVAKPEPALIAAAQVVLSSRTDVEVHLIPGNHDQTSESPGNHAMAPLRPVAHVYEKPTYVSLGGLGVLAVPFAAPMLPALDETLAVHGTVGMLGKEPWLLLGHWGIAGALVPAYMAEGKDVVPLSRLLDLAVEYPKLAGVAAGNWHTRWTGPLHAGRKCPALQVGALVPTGWDNPGVRGYGTLATWDKGEWRITEIPGPRFVVSTDDAREARAKGCAPYLRQRVPAAEVAEVRSAAEAAGWAGCSVEVADDVDVQVAARLAAASARSAETLTEALAEYVGALVLPAGVDKAEVVRLALGYLRGAK